MPNTEIIKALKKYGIFLGLLVAMMAILLGMISLARLSWKKGLTQNVQDALNYYYPDAYTVTQFHDIASTFSTSAAAFTIKSKKASSTELSYYGVLVRIPTIVGAQPALFLYTDHNGAQFVGYTIPLGKAEAVLDAQVGRSSITYWEKQIPAILEKAGIR